MNRLTTEEFIYRARKVHGNYYDYSHTFYTVRKDKVEIICPKHGPFFQRASLHLDGQGCPICAIENRRSIRRNGMKNDFSPYDAKLYQCWSGMFNRCYNEKYNPTYRGCEVCNEWRSLSSFADWYYKNYKPGWQLDKDIIGDGKLYSPDTCCFVPRKINMCIVKEGFHSITFVKKKWQATFNQKYLGRFSDKEEAIKAHNKAKAKHIREIIIQYKDELPERVVNALNEHMLRLLGLEDIVI